MLGNRALQGGAAGSPIGPLGFTLVELLVVIGIIALLTALALPTLSKAKAQANNLACQANLHAIGQSIQIYIGGSKGILPYGYWDGTFDVATGSDLGYDGAHAADWSVLLQSVISLNAGPTFNANDAGGRLAQLRAIFRDPDAPQGDFNNSFHFTLTQYASHPRLMPRLGDEDKFQELGHPGGGKIFLRPARVGRLRRSAETALIFDASLAPVVGGGWSVQSAPVADFIDNGRLLSDTFLTDQYSLSADGISGADNLDMSPQQSGPINGDDANNPRNVRFRHLGNRICNVLMADMHVESFAWTPGSATELKRGNIYVNP